MNFKTKIKHYLYDILVTKNPNINKEYSTHIQKNISRHYTKERYKDWLFLLHLNIHYRILRHSQNTPPKKTNIKLPYILGSESEISKRIEPQHLIKQLVQYDVISFDIFDTLILRPFSSPETVFSLIEEKLDIMHFALLRKNIEQDLRNKSQLKYGHREISIEDIYREIERKTGVPYSVGIQTELETELEICFANPYMKKVYEMLIATGKKIIIVSDMYFSSSMMEKILHKNGYSSYEKLYVSCDYKANKSKGDLYKIVEKDIGENLKYIHIGDNFHSDIQMAQSQGWNTHYYKNVNHLGSPYRSDGMSELIQSAYAGTINNHLHNGSESYSPQYEFGFIYGGIYIYGYVNWIHQYAKQHNIEKIIFLARDGEIYKKIYDQLFDDIPSEYFYWSRTATIKYSLKTDKYDFLRRNVLYRTLNEPASSIHEILNSMDIEFLSNKLNKFNLKLDDKLTQENADQFEHFLIDSIQEIGEKYNLEYQYVEEYIKTTLKQAKNIAIVDVGWIGSGPLSLKKIIKRWNSDCDVHCLVAASSSATYGLTRLHSEECVPYIFSRMYNRNHYDTHYNISRRGYSNYVFELFTQSCSPSFSGFKVKNNTLQFLYTEPTPEIYNIIQEIQKGIEDFALLYESHLGKFAYLKNISGYDAYCPFRMLMRSPKFIKNYLGDFPFETNTGGISKTTISLREYMEIKGV